MERNSQKQVIIVSSECPQKCSVLRKTKEELIFHNFLLLNGIETLLIRSSGMSTTTKIDISTYRESLI